MDKLNKIDIAIVENSNSIDILKKELLSSKSFRRHANRVFFVKGKLDRFSVEQGISAGEHRMLKDALYLLKRNNYQTIWKLSGRIRIRNLDKILLESSGDLIANRYFGNGHVFDTRIFGMSKIVFQDFINNIPIYTTKPTKIGSKQISYSSIELYLAKYSYDIENYGMSVNSLARIPLYWGFSASTGKKLNTFKSFLVTTLANLIRRIVVKGLIGIAP